ncbi:MAG TPA: MFS transporter [Firmicutes bacterium]|nr:MFS transporter [Candidatus Fermentithermobacillaceae bacterium]
MAKFRSWVNEASSGRPREFMTVLLLVIANGFIWQMVISVIPLLSKSLGAGEVEIGVISVIPAITTIIASVPGSLLGQKLGKRFLFISSQLTGIACALALLNARGFSQIIIAQVLFGVSNALFWPTELAYFSEIIPGHMRAGVMGYTLAVCSIAGTMGPSLGGYLIDNHGYGPVFGVYVAVVSACCLVAFTLPRSQPVGTYRGETAGSGLAGAVEVLRRPALQVTVMNTFFNSITLQTLDVFFPVLLANLGYSAMLIGTVTTVRMAGLTLMRLFIGRLTERVPAPRLLFSGLFLSSLAVGLIPLAPVPFCIYACSLLAGVGYGAVSVLTPTIIAENSDSSERGVAMALDNAAFNGGRVSSGIGIGWIGGMVGLGTSILVASAVVFSGLAYSLSVYVRNTRVPSQRYEYRNT